MTVFTSAFPAHAFHFSSSVSQDTFKDENLRDDLRFYFMNPCEKYRARKHIPWKLGVQVLKIIMITTQVRAPGHGRRSTKPQISVLSAWENSSDSSNFHIISSEHE